MILRSAFTIILYYLIAFSCSAQPLTPAQQAAIDSLVLADIPEGAPGAAVGIVRGGTVVYERYAGLADLDTGRPIEAATRFNLASNAKQFTSVRALQLADQGKLRLDEDIRRYFPDLLPDVAAPITVGQLINHTSGMRDVYDLWSIQGHTWWKKDYDNGDALALLLRQQDLNFPPGTDHLYSNSNYLLLAAIIARVTSRSFRADMGGFFRSLGMTATAFRDAATVPVPNLARPYFNFGEWTTYDLPATLHGDGGLFGTLRDQLTWEAALQTGQSPSLTTEQLRRSQLPLDTVTNYAYGLENDVYRERPVRYHNGSTGAWKASVIRFPDVDLSIVALNNSGKFFTNYLVRQIADVLLFTGEKRPEPNESPDKDTSSAEVDWMDYDFAALSGLYRSPELDVDIKVTYLGEDRYRINTVSREAEVSMTVPDELRFRGGRGVFHRAADGVASELWYSTDRARKVRFVRVE